MIFIDTHTHIYDEQFDEDRDEVIQKAIDAGVTKMLMPNCDRATVDSMMILAKKYPENCYPMMGLHPCYVKENYQEELTYITEQLRTGDFTAVGEIGLDFYWDTTFKEQQIQAFEQQIDCALELDLPIVIHCRKSLQESIDIVSNKQNENLKGVFHCFGGDTNDAKAITDLGFYLGIGGVATFKNSNLPQVLANVDLEHLLLETDAPYLAPTPYRGKRNESSYIPIIAEKISDIKQVSVEEVARVTTASANKLFSK